MASERLLALILDPLNTLKPYKDSSIALMREAARRGFQIWAIQREDLCWDHAAVCAKAVRLALPEHGPWYRVEETRMWPLTAFEAVLMRQDPPFDFEYVAATWLLDRAKAQGARIFNDPQALRNHSEKLAITEFPQYMAPTRVSRSLDALQAFIDEEKDTILKPLDGMGGSQIFRLRQDDPNRNVILETLSQNGQRTLMIQRYLPAIREGDKRVLLIGGQVVPFSLARIPKEGETRGNLAAGGRGVAMPLTPRESEIANALAPLLWARGLLIVGLDIIGGHLTEINVTSPTCFVEIEAQTGYSVASLVCDVLEKAVFPGLS
jgi:glutathione synthase